MALVQRSLDLLSSSPRVNVHHELLVCPRHYSNVLRHRKGIVELSSWLGMTVFHIPHLGVNSDLYPSVFAVLVRLLSGCVDERWVRVDNCRRKVQDAANGHRVLEGGGIQRDERGSCVGKGGGGRKGELECLLKQEATEYHKVVSIPILRLHDCGCLKACSVHEDNIIGLAKFVIRVLPG
jgi:hypothetical protein